MAIKLEMTGKCAGCINADLYLSEGDALMCYDKRINYITPPSVHCSHESVCLALDDRRYSFTPSGYKSEEKSGDKTLIEQYRNVMKAFERMLMDDQERKTASGEGIEE